MLERLFTKYHYIAKKIDSFTYKRYFFDIVDFNEKLIGIVGARGIGKTTFLLQYLKDLDLKEHQKLYFSVDSIIASNTSLFEIAESFSLSGGSVLVIDEIHKYKNFEIELKEIYDFLDINVVFSGSSAIVLEHKKADLSRRAMIYRVKGLSFREYLELKLDENFPSFTLEDLLRHHIEIATQITHKIKPIEHFKAYLAYGVYPFYFETPDTYYTKLEETINAVIESDLPIVFNIEPTNIAKLKKLVYYICNLKPFELNITALAKKIGIDRKTLYQYIHYLTLGDILLKILPNAKGDTIFSKHSKLYLNNSNLHYAYCNQADIGVLREEFFANQLYTLHEIKYPKEGDFLVDRRYLFEIGGKNKSFKQIQNVPNSFVAADEIEIGFGNKIPLWLFGFLY